MTTVPILCVIIQQIFLMPSTSKKVLAVDIGKRRKEIYMTEGVKETVCTSCIHRVVCSRMREYLGIIKEIDSCTYCSEDEDNVVAIISKVDWIVMQYPLCKYYLREQKTTRLQNICNSDSDYAQFAEGV